MPGLFDDQDRNDKKSYKKLITYFVAAVSLVMLLFLAVIYSNTKSKQDKRNALDNELMQNKQELAEELGSVSSDEYGNLKSEDLDFWDMYKDEEKQESVSENKPSSPRKEDKPKPEVTLSEDSIMPTVSENEAEETDPSHIKARAKGEEEKAYEIKENAKKNSYDFKGYLSVDQTRPEYNDRNYTVRRGVDVSKYQGTIDWAKVRADGIDYAMIRVGARGYGSGQLMLDDNYVTNMMGAKAAGLDTGVYFFSQAVTEEEAAEEANFTVGALMNYGATYPVALDIEWVDNDEARTDKLSAQERTKIAVKYCETIKAFGYKPIIYASRDMLIAGLDVDELKDYEIWLSDDIKPEKGTDYPYEFAMWQYTRKGHVDGISGDVDMNLYFISSKEK
ncbi:MAG: glycoside hydrolase family 25 protein [Lachnospiraceae bacterium]|nr:glycoside hydrolase family 25 protein [Lachnospiraceae bacterium]